MKLTSLSVQNLRVHSSREVSLSPKVTVITGANGSGKTSLLEAVYVALRGSSFRGADKDLLQAGADWWRIDAHFNDGSTRTVKFDPSRPAGRKQFVVHGKTSYRLAPKDRYPVVIFEPDDLRLLHGSPTRRREFIDRFISQLDARYTTALRKYERALKQRNTLLKRAGATSDDLFAWNVALSEYGAYIIDSRINFIESINQRIGDEYHQIAQSGDTVSVHYSHTSIGDVRGKLLGELHANIDRDRLLGYTSAGPHRHDVRFMFNNSPATGVASRGEVRTIVLALKFIEITIIRQLTGSDPIILLDDVFSELDHDRQNYLMNSPKGQIIITSAHTPARIKLQQTIKL